MRICAFLICVTVLTGCQYERSFMNIDSNSGIPFLGLQLSVDAREFGETSVRQGLNTSTAGDQEFIALAQSPDSSELPTEQGRGWPRSNGTRSPAPHQFPASSVSRPSRCTQRCAPAALQSLN